MLVCDLEAPRHPHSQLVRQVAVGRGSLTGPRASEIPPVQPTVKRPPATPGGPGAGNYRRQIP
jgi:hypothetical protein